MGGSRKSRKSKGQQNTLETQRGVMVLLALFLCLVFYLVEIPERLSLSRFVSFGYPRIVVYLILITIFFSGIFAAAFYLFPNDFFFSKRNISEREKARRNLKVLKILPVFFIIIAVFCSLFYESFAPCEELRVAQGTFVKHEWKRHSLRGLRSYYLVIRQNDKNRGISLDSYLRERTRGIKVGDFVKIALGNGPVAIYQNGNCIYSYEEHQKRVKNRQYYAPFWYFGASILVFIWYRKDKARMKRIYG